MVVTVLEGLRDYGRNVRPVALNPSLFKPVGFCCIPLLNGIVHDIVNWPGVSGCKQNEERHADGSGEPWETLIGFYHYGDVRIEVCCIRRLGSYTTAVSAVSWICM